MLIVTMPLVDSAILFAAYSHFSCCLTFFKICHFLNLALYLCWLTPFPLHTLHDSWLSPNCYNAVFQNNNITMITMKKESQSHNA